MCSNYPYVRDYSYSTSIISTGYIPNNDFLKQLFPEVEQSLSKGIYTFHVEVSKVYTE